MLIAALALKLIVLHNLTRPHSSNLNVVHQVVNATCGGGNARVVDGAWERQLFLHPRVSLEDANTLIRAIRRGDVANKQKIPSEGRLAGIIPPMPFIDADQIVGISDHKLEDGSRAFEVRTGCNSGRSYLIVMVNNLFELREVRAWIA